MKRGSSLIDGAASAPSGAEDDGTNVRVAARVRPLLPREQAENCCSCITVHQDTQQIVVGTKRTFPFDVVFDQEAHQEEVYNQCVKELLHGCFQGYNATILAYGQTGSGKTHSMGSGNIAMQSEDEYGIIPRVMGELFAYIDGQSSENTEFKISCCYIEIYNDDIRDLMSVSTGKNLISIRETAEGSIQVNGILTEVCRNIHDMMRCLSDGSVQRTTGATLMNEQSSRSHSIFTVIVEHWQREAQQHGAVNDADTDGASSVGNAGDRYKAAKFHLVDLAGSERAKRTGAVGSRFKESVSINSGLLALGNVISALGDPSKKVTHVPYRESKLTRLLQDSLGGNSRTWMIACVSPADTDFEESLNTLKYAHRARNIKNKPVVNRDPKMAQLAAMQDEIAVLRSKLQQMTHTSPSSHRESLEVSELTEKLETAERHCVEVEERLMSMEAEKATFRNVLWGTYATLCQHLPVLCQVRLEKGPSNDDAGASVTEALKVVWQTLSSEIGSADTPSEPQTLPLPPKLDTDGFGYIDNDEGALKDGSITDLDASGTGRLHSLAEMRKDSTLLIRQYLGEISRLETELAQYRRKTRQLQDELREAKDDLRRDEEIFGEKMEEMKLLQERRDELLQENSQLLMQLETFTTDKVGSFAQQMSIDLAQQVEDTDNVRIDGAEGSPDREPETSHPNKEEIKQSQQAQKDMGQELQTLMTNVTLKEDLIRELVKSEKEWSNVKAQYQHRIEQMQTDLNSMQKELEQLQSRLDESENVKEQKKHLEEERKGLERKIQAQMQNIQKKQLEYSKMREQRHKDSKKIKDLEGETSRMRKDQSELERKIKHEKERTIRLEEQKERQIGDLRRRLAEEGRRVAELEAENLKQRTALRRSEREGQQRPSFQPMSRKNSTSSVPRTPDGQAGARSASLGATHASTSSRPDSVQSSRPSTEHGSRAQLLEQEIDGFLRRREATETLEEDMKKRETLLRKRDQYFAYRQRIVSKQAQQLSEYRERIDAIDAELASEAPESQQKVEDLMHQKHQLQETVQNDDAESMTVLQEVDEKLEALQDELDFRESKITKAKQLVSQPNLSPSLEMEFSNLSAEDARELLGRYCQKIVKLRQRERQTGKRLTSLEDQIEEKARQISELQQVLRRHDANAAKNIARATREHEAKVNMLLKQLSSTQGGAKGSVVRADGSPEDENKTVEDLKRDNRYFRDTNRELKRRLREALDEGGRSRANAEEMHLKLQRLQQEKEKMETQNTTMQQQIQNLKQYASKFHSIASVAVNRNELLQVESPDAGNAAT